MNEQQEIYLKNHSKEFIEFYFKQLNEVGDLLRKLTPVDAEICVGHTYAGDLLLLEEKYGIKRSVVEAQWQILIDLYEYVTGEKYVLKIYESIGFAVVNEYSISKITVF